MDNFFKQAQYPITSFKSSLTELNDTQADALKETFLDFKITLYSNDITAPPLVYLSKVIRSNSIIQLVISIKVKFADNQYVVAGRIVLPFEIGTSIFSSNYPSDTIRVHFDSSDAVDLDNKIQHIDGHASFKNVSTWLDTFKTSVNLETIPVLFEPSTISIIGNHSVSAIRCQSAKPLINQTAGDRYTALSDPITGNVNIIGGNNCIVSLQQINNTVLISAVKNANGTEEEICGIWKDKTATSAEDILCNEGVYSIGGAYPDESGNIIISGDYPINVSSLTRDQLPENFSNYIGNNFSHIDRFIFIGTPTRALDSACAPINVEPCPQQNTV